MAARSVTILGDTGGLGAAFARAFCENGDTVIGASRTAPDPNDDAYERHLVDATKESDVVGFAAKLRRQGTTPDIVLNCAGVMDESLLLMTPAQQFMRVLTTNVLSAFLIGREFAKLMMAKRSGLIVSFSTIHVEAATVGAGAYAASKSAIETLARVLNAELAGTNVRSCCIALSYVDSLGMAGAVNPQAAKTVLKAAPTRRVVPFEEVFELVAALADGAYPSSSPVIKVGI